MVTGFMISASEGHSAVPPYRRGSPRRLYTVHCCSPHMFTPLRSMFNRKRHEAVLHLEEEVMARESALLAEQKALADGKDALEDDEDDLRSVIRVTQLL
jgi:hypothetical protein